MNTNSPLFDASVAVSLVNAKLCEAPAKAAVAPPDFAGSANAFACPCELAADSKWRRLVHLVLSPISGPTLRR